MDLTYDRDMGILTVEFDGNDSDKRRLMVLGALGVYLPGNEKYVGDIAVNVHGIEVGQPFNLIGARACLEVVMQSA